MRSWPTLMAPPADALPKDEEINPAALTFVAANMT